MNVAVLVVVTPAGGAGVDRAQRCTVLADVGVVRVSGSGDLSRKILRVNITENLELIEPHVSEPGAMAPALVLCQTNVIDSVFGARIGKAYAGIRPELGEWDTYSRPKFFNDVVFDVILGQSHKVMNIDASVMQSQVNLQRLSSAVRCGLGVELKVLVDGWIKLDRPLVTSKHDCTTAMVVIIFDHVAAAQWIHCDFGVVKPVVKVPPVWSPVAVGLQRHHIARQIQDGVGAHPSVTRIRFRNRRWRRAVVMERYAPNPSSDLSIGAVGSRISLQERRDKSSPPRMVATAYLPNWKRSFASPAAPPVWT